jgi:hypothetical protein
VDICGTGEDGDDGLEEKRFDDLLCPPLPSPPELLVIINRDDEREAKDVVKLAEFLMHNSSYGSNLLESTVGLTSARW